MSCCQLQCWSCSAVSHQVRDRQRSRFQSSSSSHLRDVLKKSGSARFQASGNLSSRSKARVPRRINPRSGRGCPRAKPPASRCRSLVLRSQVTSEYPLWAGRPAAGHVREPRRGTRGAARSELLALCSAELRYHAKAKNAASTYESYPGLKRQALSFRSHKRAAVRSGSL